MPTTGSKSKKNEVRAMLKTATFLVVGAALSAADLVAVPFALSAVTLTGDWGDAQRRNQEVLLSLNMTSWSCQFTNTANLTSCASDNCIAPGRAGMPSCIPLPGEMSLVRPQPFIRRAWRKAWRGPSPGMDCRVGITGTIKVQTSASPPHARTNRQRRCALHRALAVSDRTVD